MFTSFNAPRSNGMTRWHWRRYYSALLLFSVVVTQYSWAESSIVATRIWPARAYTRITLESDAAIPFKSFTMAEPKRLVIDLKNVNDSPALQHLAAKVAMNDPYIRHIRVGRYQPGTLRMVIDLKSEVEAQLFALQPYAVYQHRLVIDLYPRPVDDPLLAIVGEDALSDTRLAFELSQDANDDKKDKKPLSNTSTPKSAKRLIVIMIDPGHGGEDPGAIGRKGTFEKDVTLALALKLKTLLEKQPNIRALLTRDADYYVSLGDRVQKARRASADLFVSIHADAFIKPHARGSSVFALSAHGATSTAATWLAQRENRADLIGGVKVNLNDQYLARTLFDLTQTATINDSLKWGQTMLNAIAHVNKLHKPRVEQAGFAVLKAPDIPSVLIETAFISNPEEEKRLTNPHYQYKFAQALANGIQRYLSKNPPLVRTNKKHANLK